MSGAVDSRDPLDLGVDAAEIGTWNWHIRSGRVDWTSWTYQLFGSSRAASSPRTSCSSSACTRRIARRCWTGCLAR